MRDGQSLPRRAELHPGRTYGNGVGTAGAAEQFHPRNCARGGGGARAGESEAMVQGIANRWQSGTLVLRPADASAQAKEVPLETFFHKIVMIRNNLRVLEQKVNASDKLSDADKFELQQYITRCYGSLTTFNILFKKKEDQFSSGP